MYAKFIALPFIARRGLIAVALFFLAFVSGTSAQEWVQRNALHWIVVRMPLGGRHSHPGSQSHLLRVAMGLAIQRSVQVLI